MIVLESKLSEILALHIADGSHESLEKGFCVMEAVAYVAGEPWSDHPKCACPVVAAFLRNWNDSLPDDATRDRLLKPIIPMLVDSKSTQDVEARRSYLALDWLVRVLTPKFLDLVPSLASHAKALRDHEEIADLAGAGAAAKFTAAARAAAVAAARTAAGDAAAVAAAGDAAGAAARAAAGEAELEAAWEGAWEAAKTAAGAAAGDALNPTVQWLQLSALDLVERMIALQPVVVMGVCA